MRLGDEIVSPQFQRHVFQFRIWTRCGYDRKVPQIPVLLYGLKDLKTIRARKGQAQYHCGNVLMFGYECQGIGTIPGPRHTVPAFKCLMYHVPVILIPVRYQKDRKFIPDFRVR